ncbi:MAG: phosphate/phosphite/phosphonate ABC transporter substrate-binding protein [bacterium]|nr:phosphate/phosphite/phosphonate ABC transporter substrate-binding protein [bacterium]
MTRTRTLCVCLLLGSLALLPVSGGEPALTLVACAPGYPGNTEQAQPTMDEFARGVARASGWSEGRLSAVYHEKLEPGLSRLERDDAAVALVPLPFYFEFHERLGLRPILQGDPQGGPGDRWTLVAPRGRVSGPDDLDAWTLLGMPGYSPRFVRDVALAGWGALPDGVKIEFSARLLSSLRRVSRGEDVVVLLDRGQASALDQLPFADALEVVHTSGETASSLVCAVGDRLSAEDRRALDRALREMHENEAGRETLELLQLSRFREVTANPISGLDAGPLADP